MTYVEINIAKKVKDLFTENYRTLLKGFKGDINRKTSITHRLTDLILLKYPFYQKHSTALMDSLSKFQRQCWKK